MKQTTELKDMLGQTLAVGDRVALSSYHNLGLAVGVIEKLGRVRAQVRPIKTNFANVRDDVESIGTNSLIKL